MYLLDSDVLIRAKNDHYGFDFCPAFWAWLDAARSEGKVGSVRLVYEELAIGADVLADWVKARKDFFHDEDGWVTQSLAAVSGWASNAGYSQAALQEFLKRADYYLVAWGHAHGHSIVTHERPRNSANKIKIPDACLGMGVQWVTPFRMLRDESARFVLG